MLCVHRGLRLVGNQRAVEAAAVASASRGSPSGQHGEYSTIALEKIFRSYSGDGGMGTYNSRVQASGRVTHGCVNRTLRVCLRQIGSRLASF